MEINQILIKIAIVLGSILFVLLIYFLLKSTPQRYYSKAAKQHSLGEKRYLRGNHDGAESAYQKAEELRKRARELE